MTQLVHGVQPVLDHLPVHERLLDHLVELPGAHRGACPVQDPQEGSALFLFAHGLRELQVSSRGAVQQHVLADRIDIDARDVGQRVHLRVVEILEERAGRDAARPLVVHTKGDQAGHMEVRKDHLAGCSLVKIVHAQRIDDDPEPVCQVLQVQSGEHEFVVAYDLRRRAADDLVVDLAVAFRLRHVELAGRDVRDGYAAETLSAVQDAENKVVLPLFEGIHVEIGAGSHDPCDFALYHALCGAGIFHLVANGGFVALLHKAGQIAVQGMKRNAAHGRSLGQAAALSCERQLQLPGHDLGVIKEHLIKIAEPVKQDTARIFLFGLQIMLHHGTEFG